MNQSSVGLGPPPLQTPITANSPDEFAVPFQQRGLASGNVNIAWAAWFNEIGQRLASAEIILSSTQANLATLAASLTTADTGTLVNVTDYGHLLMWTGSAWSWAPGEQGSGMLVLFEIDPTGVGWHLYDGATVNYLKADGTTGSVTLPNLAGTAAYPKAGSPNSGPNAAVAPTLSGNTASATTGITVSAAGAATASSGTAQSGAGQAVLTALTSGGGGGGAVTDPGHIHGLTGASASATGEPRNLVRRPWFRQ